MSAITIRSRESLVKTVWRRLSLATVLWVAFWPILWFVRIGDITGPKAWFWIVGELNYPIVAIMYLLADNIVISYFTQKPWRVFLVSVVVVALITPFYYQRAGFAFGVLAEAFLF